MALPPTIPTSFVPHQSSSEPKRFRLDYAGAFGFLAYVILGIVFLLALGVFIYGRILATEKSSKDKKLLAAEQAVDSQTVENFVRLRDRLVSSKMLLDKHIAFSGFFEAFGGIIPSTVRFTELRLSNDIKGMSKVEGSGVAKNFNTLAATSMAFASDGRIKDAIFSNLKINSDSSVAFALTATLDPKIVVFSP
jgi:hypothetical protein